MAPSSGWLGTWTVFILTFSSIFGWDTDDLELFDLVEDVNQNFYELLGVKQDSETSEIRKAYRKLSLQLHPDKNKADDAEVQFRQLVAVYEVLKDDDKRQKYNLVLEHGLPDWRQPVFYYRRVRKMGLLELSILLCVILTVGQYLVVWSIYIERRFTLEENVADLKKKTERKAKKKRERQGMTEEDLDEALQEGISAIPRPKLVDLWPLKLTVFLFWTIIQTPQHVQRLKLHIQESRERKIQEEQESEDESDGEETTVVRRPKKRQKMELPDYDSMTYSDITPVVYSQLCNSNEDPDSDVQNIKQEKLGDWTDEELALLAKAVAKFPGGSAGRWEKIAEVVGRPVSQVISKSKEVKGSYVMNINVALQGNDLKSSQKNQTFISDDIISKKDDDIGSLNTDLSVEEAQPRRRHKPTKSVKSVDRTLLISQKSEETTSQPKKLDSEQNQITSKSEASGSAKEVENCDKNGVPEGGTKTQSEQDIWTQNQQMTFEWALRQYPKGTEQRWEKIAEHITGKSKEDCLARFKYLADLVKRKKQTMQQSDGAKK